MLALKLADAERELAEAGERLKEAEAQVNDLTRLVGLATTAQAEAATALPPLRNDEAAAAAALQRLRVAHDALTAEAERVAQAQQEAGTRLAQTETDLEREHGRKSDAAAAIADLDSQRERLEQERVGEDERAAEAAATRDAAQADTLAAETEHDRLTRQIADDEALRESVSREVAELRERLRRLAARRDEVTAQQQQVEAELSSLPALPEVEAALAEARLAFEEARRKGQESIDAAREAERYESDAARAAVAQAEAERIDMERARAAERQAAEASHATANETLQKVNARLTKLRAEESGVAAALKSSADSLWPPLLDALTVDPGFEKALGAAFGEELEASSDRGAPIHWLPLGPIADAPALPDGADAAWRARQGDARARASSRLHRRRCRRGDGGGPAGRPEARPAARDARRRGVALGRLHAARRRTVDGGGAAQPAQPAGRDPPADRGRRGRACRGPGARRGRDGLARRRPRRREDLRRAGPRA